MIPLPKGFTVAGVRCGLKNKRNDLGLIVSDRPALSAGVFTTNHVRASCVDYSRRVVSKGHVRAIVVNSGNANCCTGVQGERDTARMAELVGKELSVDPELIAVGSTGIIGHLLDMAKVERGVREAAQKLGVDAHAFMDAILTTDLVEKWAWVQPDNLEVVSPHSLTPRTPDTDHNGLMIGFVKGSGMIAPNMATMLGYVITDLDVEGLDVQAILKRVADNSFNCMTVDSDTSTNDMLIVLANGGSGVKADEAAFEQALGLVCTSLAKQVARDGEGATKLVEIRVTGTENPKKIARSIGDSPLVKTAMFGCDPNWGRILMAAGKCGVPFQPSDVKLSIIAADEEHLLFEEGAPASFDPKRVSSALKSDHVVIDLRLGDGETATIYTCDFGYGYVRINAEYHT
ncbi:MAG: bifunctional glutamate N-acetyltransferase/amino-acid acetyltransferase ArgJ [Fimbriimonas sp.]|nr:bifunctional glutamate N-acetyltransferase/amino-acid acetyltransferase ArgJ [Fimbriimonas sp.]